MRTFNSELGELRNQLILFRGLFVSIGAISFAIGLLMLAPTLYMMQIYDRVLSSRNVTTLLMLTMIMLLLYAIEALLEWVRSCAMVRGAAAIDLRLSPRVFEAAFKHTLSNVKESAVQAFGDLSKIRLFLGGKGLFALFDAPWSPIYLLVIFLLHPWLGGFALLAVLSLLTLAWINERTTSESLLKANKEAQSANYFANSHMMNAEAIEAMGMLGTIRQRWLHRQRRMLSFLSMASERAAIIGASTKFFRISFQSFIFGLGALLVIENQLTPGGMLAASILLGRALSPIDQIISSWRGMVSAKEAYSRLTELLKAHPAAPQKIALPRPNGHVIVENLVVSPPGSNQLVLKGINFVATPGTLIAVVGPSASGKSTLARALVGVWPPTKGVVRLDGADVSQWNKEELGPWIGYLPQDVELFEGTVAENISRFGTADANKTVEAAQRAGVHEMILRLPQGYETPIGEGGMALSGGQRQRIGLARAMFGDPSLIVLDEPNSNLDEAGDAALQRALHEIKREKRTVFVLTHRVNILRAADAVLVLSNGTVQAYGPRDSILEAMRKDRASVGRVARSPVSKRTTA